MTRTQLEHIIRAASAITGEADIVIVGSQSILGSFADAPEALLASREADVFPLAAPEAADLIDGCIGELSPFDQTFGYYAHGVGPETSVLPTGWQDRLVPLQNVNTGSGTGLCLEPHDLAVAKLIAGRPKDLDFIETLLSAELVQADVIESRLNDIPKDPRLPLAKDRLTLLVKSEN